MNIVSCFETHPRTKHQMQSHKFHQKRKKEREECSTSLHLHVKSFSIRYLSFEVAGTSQYETDVVAEND